MTVLSFVVRANLRSRVGTALSSAHFFIDDVASAKECLQAAQVARYQDFLMDSDSFAFAELQALVTLVRQDNSDTSIFVVSRHLDLEKRLSLFEAGVDDCVTEPFSAARSDGRT